MKYKLRKFVVPAVLIALFGVLGGCSSMPPKQVSEGIIKTPYIIGPGDVLQIYVRNNPDISVTVPVRPDGRISIPMVQTIRAAGETPATLANKLQNALSKYIRNPTVTVIVTQFVGTYSNQIKVVGEAVKPQAIPYRRGMTLLDLMIQVGGLTKFAAGNDAKLIRKVNGHEKTYQVDLEDLLNGDMEDNVELRPGDVLIIPRSMF